MKSIVTGYDGSACAERALARSAELAERLGAELVVVSVGRSAGLMELEPSPVDPTLVPTGVGPAATGGLMPVPLPPAREQADETRLLLERARSFLAQRRVEADYVAETGDPADRLLDVADDRDADLIVVGSREHGLLERLLGHCVEEQLARRAQRDVLLVR
jgi:nucleotide-binding universal stress UspA family protein